MPEGLDLSGRKEIRLTGFGGQGVVMAGHILGRAFAIGADQHATMIQSFGPEARGSSCSATLVVSPAEILYPYIQRPDILVAMSNEGYQRFHEDLKDDGLLIFEQDLVHHPSCQEGQRCCGIPSTRIAESLGRAIVQNIVMVGFFAGVTRIVPWQIVREAVEKSVPGGTEKLNLEAFDRGLEYANRLEVHPTLEVKRPPLEEVTR